MFYRSLPVPVLNCQTESQAWPRLVLFMSLMGRFLSRDTDTTIKVRNNKVFFISNSSTEEIVFENCTIFDTTGIQADAQVHEARPSKFLVLDDLELSCLGGKHSSLPGIDKATDGFARRVEFYSSPRVDGANYITDCVVESLLTQEEVYQFENSDTMARFVVERHLENCGVTGPVVSHYKSGKPKYRKPKVKSVKRLVFKKDATIYVNTENLKFKKANLQEVLDGSLT